MKVTIERIDDVPTLRLEVKLDMAKQSRSGNSTVIATTRGQQLIGKVNGRDTYLQLNVTQVEPGSSEVQIEDKTASADTGRKRAA